LALAKLGIQIVECRQNANPIWTRLMNLKFCPRGTEGDVRYIYHRVSLVSLHLNPVSILLYAYIPLSVMGRLVKLIGSGIGLASEAIAAHKAEKAERAANPNAGEGSSSSQSSRPHASRDTARSYYPEDDPPPQYAEVTDQEADQLIAKGKAVPVDSKDELRLAQKLHNLHDDDDDDETSEEGDEEQWDLDDAIEAETPSAEDGPAPRSTEQIIDGFMRNHPPPTYTERESIVRGQLPCPVIIPQRRPRDKKRGFVRAYAPVLADCGIDQATFLEFLKSFHQSSREDPWLNVVNLAAAGAGFAPSAIAMGVSIAVQFAVGVAMEVQRRTRYYFSSS
jgi:hypothetical protein